MNRLLILITTAAIFFIYGCTNTSTTNETFIDIVFSSSDPSNSEIIEATIDPVGDVDKYHLYADATDQTIQIKCTNNSSDVVLHIKIFEKDNNGDFSLIEELNETSEQESSGDLIADIYIDRSKDLYIYVSDYENTNVSSNPYYLSAHYQDTPVVVDDKKVTLKGEILTQPPVLSDFPLRVILAIDCSESMASSDPVPAGETYPARIQAARSFIEAYQNYDDIKFSIILWNSEIIGSTSGFTKDSELIDTILYGYSNTSDKNYMTVIRSAESHILNEISEMRNTESEADTISRLKCIVLFLTDTVPEPKYPTEYTDAFIELRHIRERMIEDQGIGDFNFNTFYLSTTADPDSRDYIITSNLMTRMSNNGGGDDVEFQNPESIDFINTVDLKRVLEYKIKSIVAFNTNVSPGQNLILVDSDGDGIADSDEDKDGDGIVTLSPETLLPVETDPTKRDSDGDGISDFTEVRFSQTDTRFNPVVHYDFDCDNESEQPDTDNDGLSDCDESVIGTRINNPDTDSDGFSDYVEFIMNSTPLEDAPEADTDFDGVADWLEIQKHSNPAVNDKTTREQFSYQYLISDLGSSIIDEGTGHELRRKRFSFTISNISIMNTLETYDTAAGDNTIRLFIAEVPEHMPNSQPVYRSVDIVVNYHDTTDETIEVDSFAH